MSHNTNGLGLSDAEMRKICEQEVAAKTDAEVIDICDLDGSVSPVDIQKARSWLIHIRPEAKRCWALFLKEQNLPADFSFDQPTVP